MRLLHLAFLALLLPGYIGGCLFLYRGDDFQLAAGFFGGTGTLHFHVRSGPLNPVGTEGVENSAPLEGATLEVVDADDRVVAFGSTDAGGNLELSAPPGSYTVRALPFGEEAFPAPPGEQHTSVVAGVIVEIELDYDSGIR